MPLIRGSLVALALKDMSKVTSAVDQLTANIFQSSLPVSTSDLDAGHEHRFVLVSVDCSWDGIEESGPSTS
jgi:hypothetical protein